MPRRPRRRTPRIATVLWVALVGNVAAGLAFSPLTQVRRIRVSGADRTDEDRVKATLGRIAGKSAAMIDVRLLESAILTIPAVRAASFQRNAFGSARLKMAYDRPVASLDGAAPNVAFLEGGEFLESSRTLDSLPSIHLPPDAGSPSIGLVSNWNRSAVVALAVEAERLWPGQRARVEVESTGVLCLNNDGMARVTLGSSDRLADKLARLESALRDQPDLLSRVDGLNLSSPDRPAVKMKMPVRNR